MYNVNIVTFLYFNLILLFDLFSSFGMGVLFNLFSSLGIGVLFDLFSSLGIEVLVWGEISAFLVYFWLDILNLKLFWVPLSSFSEF